MAIGASGPGGDFTSDTEAIIATMEADLATAHAEADDAMARISRLELGLAASLALRARCWPTPEEDAARQVLEDQDG